MTQSILVSSAGSKIPFIQLIMDAAKRLEKTVNVIAGDSNPQAMSKFFADDFWILPQFNEIDDSRILEELIQREISLVIPTRDGELAKWARLRNLLNQNNIEVLTSSSESLQITMDKLRFHDWLVENDLPSIPTFEDSTKIEEELVVVKERYAESPKKTFVSVPIDTAEQVSKNHLNPVFQYFIPGKEVSVDVWRFRSGNISVTPRTRDQIIDGEARVTTFFQNSYLEELTRALAVRLNLYGPAVFQFIQKRDEEFLPIECNARFGGASTFSINTRHDSIYLALCEIFNEFPSNEKKGNGYQTQVRVHKDYYFR